MRVFILYIMRYTSLCALGKIDCIVVVVSVYIPSRMSKPFKNSPLTLSAGYANGTVHVAVKPPTDGERQGIVLTLIFDVSGSMSSNACKVGDDATQYHTRLDLLKVVAELQVRMLGEMDTLCLITFSDNGQIILQPTLMTGVGKDSAVNAIKGMRAEGCTNLWNSLEVAQEVMSRPEYAESLRYAIMLTDGEESYPAPAVGGTVGGFAELPRSFILNIFGFGSQLDSSKLAALTNTAGGRFSNIADFMTLATTSINCLATGLASCSTGDTVLITYEDGSSTEHKTSLVQFGQDRNIVFKTAKKPVNATLQRGAAAADFTGEISPQFQARADILAALHSTLASSQVAAAPYAAIYARYPGMADVAELNTELPSGCAGDNWAKWGKHYHWAYLQALENDHRMNFKEVGQAHLGGAAFERYKKIGDAVYSQIPKPRPTGGSTSTGSFQYGGAAAIRTVAAMAHTNDPTNAGGCWAPGSMVRMADGTRKAIELVQPDDKIWTTTGDATVEYTLKLGRHKNPVQNMCRVGRLLLTWYHPVKQGLIWVPPCTVAAIEQINMPVVHNLIVSNGHVLDIEGILTVSLGHGLDEEGVEHAFFGSKARILDAIKLQPGFAERRVVYQNLVAVRDSGAIVGWEDS